MRCRVLGSRARLANCDLVREQRLTISFRSLVPNPAVASLIASASSLAMYCFRSRLCCCSWVAHSASEEASSAASLRARIIDSMNADMLVISPTPVACFWKGKTPSRRKPLWEGVIICCQTLADAYPATQARRFSGALRRYSGMQTRCTLRTGRCTLKQARRLQESRVLQYET